MHLRAAGHERAPQVLCTLRKMEETGCDIFLDIHGDEEARS